MTLLTIIQNALDETGLAESQPSIIIGNSDKLIRRALSLLEKLGKELLEEHDWRDLIKEFNFTTDGSGDYIVGTDILTDGDFERFVDDSIFDRTNDDRVVVVDGRGWQALESSGVTAGVNKYIRIRGDKLLLKPVSTGDSIYGEYVSNYWIEGSGGSAKGSFTADDDVVLFDETLLEEGLKYKLKASYNLPAAIEFDVYDRKKERLIASERMLQEVNLCSNKRSYGKEVFNGRVVV